LTEMRPSMISCSISRRDPRPACARTLCSLGVSGWGASTRLSAVASPSACWSKSPETTSAKLTGGSSGAGGAFSRRWPPSLPSASSSSSSYSSRSSSSSSSSCEASARACATEGSGTRTFSSSSLLTGSPAALGWCSFMSGERRLRLVFGAVGGVGVGGGFDRELGLLRIFRRREGVHQLGLLRGAFEHGELVERLEAQVVEELARRGVQRGTPRCLAMANDLDPAAVLQLLEDLRVDRDAADFFHVAARRGLAVRDDRQRFQHGARVLGRLLGMQAVEVFPHLRPALEAPARGDLHQLDAALLPVVLQLREQRLDGVGAELGVEQDA